MTYPGGAVRAPETGSRFSLLPFLGLAILLSALRVVATTAALNGPPSGRTQSLTQTWLLAGLWILAYFVEAVAGWLLWRSRSRAYGRAAMVLFWILLGLQALRLGNLLGSRLTAGQVPWSAFGTVVLLDVVLIVVMLTAWPVSRRAAVLLALVLCWLLYVTGLSGADALLQNGLPLT